MLAAAVAAPSAQAAPLRFSAVGTFTDRVRDLLVADVDQDSIGDLVVASDCGATVLLGTGNGTYTESQRLNNPGMCEEYVLGTLTVGDVDGDKKVNVILGRNDNNHAWVFTRTASGAFVDTPQTLSMIGGGSSPNTTPGEIVTGDLNGDGREDLIVLVPGFDAGIHVLLANPTGFDPLVRYPLDTMGYEAIATGRVDADGTLDVILGGSVCKPACSNGVQTFNGNGDGTLTPGSFTAAAGPVWAVLTAPLRAVGRDDVVVTSKTFQSLLSAPDGALTAGPQKSVMAPAGGFEAAAGGDVDGDGRTDIVTAGGDVTQLVTVGYGDGAGSLRWETAFGPAAAVGTLSDAQVTDADRDGDLDRKITVKR